MLTSICKKTRMTPTLVIGGAGLLAALNLLTYTLFRFDKYGERKHPGIGQSCQHSHDYQKPD